MGENTPAMQQYYDLKDKYTDSILFFRMGDFYEMFAGDAEIAHKVLGINITSRNKNAQEPIALAGIPYHSLDKYLPILVHAGYKVAIAEQVSDPRLKGIVKREVVRVVSPGTLGLEGEEYENTGANNLVCIAEKSGEYGISIIELSTNVWKTGSFKSLGELSSEIYKLYPKEIILSKNLFENRELQEILQKKYSLNIYYYELQKNPKKLLLEHFSTKNLHAFGIEDKELCIFSSATLLDYISHNQKSQLQHLDTLSYTCFNGYLELDASTIQNLDLIYNLATNSAKNGTLLGVVDQTKTPMGKRQLKENIIRPFQDLKDIEHRHALINALIDDKNLLEKVQNELSGVSDIDLILTRLILGRSGPKDLLNLKRALVSIQNVIKIIKKSKNKKLIKLLSL